MNPDEDVDLRSALERLAKVSPGTANAAIGSPQPSISLIIRTPVSLSFEANGRPIIGGWRGDLAEEPLPVHTSQAFSQSIEQTDEFRNAERILIPRSKAAENVQFLLMDFAGKSIQQESERDLHARIGRFIQHIDGAPCEYVVKAQMQGILCEPESISCNPGITIRRPRIEDYEIRDSTYDLGGSNVMKIDGMDSILEIKMKATKRMQVYNVFNRILATLRLFRVGAVDFIQFGFASECVEVLGSGTHGHINSPTAHPKYVLARSDSPKLESFLAKFEKHWTISDTWGQAHDPVSIAFHHYSDSLLRPASEEWRISTCMMGLEALYLGGTTEVAYKLRVRASKLLDAIGHDGNETLRTLAEAYDYRSRFLHGSSVTEAKRNRIREILPVAQNILRESIVIFSLQDGAPESAKSNVIDVLDSSLISTRNTRELEAIVSVLRPSSNETNIV